MEGFICPECHENFQSPGLLERHFESHSGGGGASIAKNIFSKALDAKNRWLGYEEPEPSNTPSPAPSSRYGTTVDWGPQQIGAMNDMTKLFRAVRPKRISHSQVEINKLMIRLDKLVSALLQQADGRRNLKDIEKSTIPWVSNGGNCVACDTVLNLLSRKHHCRLCTGLLCTDCSKFVSLHTAAFALGKTAISEEHDIRLCTKCQNVIQDCVEEMKSKHVDKTFVQMYEKLSSSILTNNTLCAEYETISHSLEAGEACYTLEYGNEFRVKLIKQMKIVDVISEKISGLRVSDSPAQEKLQKNIRQYVKSYLQDNLHKTRPLPDYEELRELQAAGLERAKEAVRRQKEEALRNAQRVQYNKPQDQYREPSPSPPSDDFTVIKSKQDVPADSPWAGWTGEAVQPKPAHPLIEQRDILRGYLEQARDANRADEAKALEESLDDIMSEIIRQGLHDWT